METICAQVVICGAGTAGLPAALMAARQGCSVLLIEEDLQIGGAFTDNFVQNFCGNPIQGVYREIIDKMQAFAPASRNPNCFRYTSFIMAWNALLRGLPVRILIGQRIYKTEMADHLIKAVETEDYRVEGDIFIDATGNGDVAAMAGCPFRYGREAKAEYGERFAPEKADNKVQLCTLLYTVRRMEGVESEDANWAVLDGEEFLIWGPTVSCEDTTSRTALAQAQQQAMAMMEEHSRNWQEKGYYITGAAPRLGVRESRRILGEYVLSYGDVMARTSYPDGIAVVNYPIDPWDPDGNPLHADESMESVQTPDYEIPYRCLVNGTVDNLLVAGRCISATHVVNSSLRVMAIAMILGQAAGNAAALAVQAGTAARDISTPRLRDMLRSQGVRVSLSESLVSK